MTIEHRLKYMGFPPIRGESDGIKSIALMHRALFTQNNKTSMGVFQDIAQNIDYDALDVTANLLNSTPKEVLFVYFSSLGLKKEFYAMTEEDADSIIKLL